MPATSLGEFEVTVLLAILQLGDDVVGIRIRDEIERRSGRRATRGAVYVTLDRLEDKGLLKSRLADASPERGGHPRRYFNVTPTGIKTLRHSLAMLGRMRAGLDAVLGKL